VAAGNRNWRLAAKRANTYAGIFPPQREKCGVCGQFREVFTPQVEGSDLIRIVGYQLEYAFDWPVCQECCDLLGLADDEPFVASPWDDDYDDDYDYYDNCDDPYWIYYPGNENWFKTAGLKFWDLAADPSFEIVWI